MSQEIHATAGQNAPEIKDNWFVENAKKYTPTMLFMILSAFVVSYWTSRDNLNDLTRRVTANEQMSSTNATNIAKNAENYNQLLIAFTKISENQIRMAKDIQDIQERERRELEAQLNRK